jgi:glucose/arabinose dehydrogenase
MAKLIEVLERRVLLSAAAGPASPATTASFATTQATLSQPSVAAVNPANGATNVPRDTFIAFDLHLPNVGGGVNPATLTTSTLALYRTSDHTRIPAHYNTSGGGDDIVLQPRSILDANTQFTVFITSGVQDTKGAAFKPFTSTFTTGTAGGNTDPSIAFQQLPQSASAGHAYTCVTFGPDGKLYASTLDGLILRFTVNADGSLSSPQTISTVNTANGGKRTITGLLFDPKSTASNPILYASNNAFFTETQIASDWTGKVSVLSGANLTTYRDLVIHLPRSIRDHMTNQLSFGPDGALYWGEAAMNSFGAADSIWGNRPEHLLSSNILRLDLTKLGNTTLDAKTKDGGGTYNPFAAGAPLTIYAQGVRNAYNLLWDSNGHLYAPSNGSSSGGNTPAGGGAPALTNLPFSEDDHLFKITPGKYYGHPNPNLNHYVLNGGNPTSGKDLYEVPQYPVGTRPDPNWTPAIWDFGKHLSPDGIIEYTGSAFGGKLNHKLLICRESGESDIVVLTLNSSGNVVSQQSGFAGLEGFTNPLDLIENPKTGFIYVADYGAQRITLIKPINASTVHEKVSSTSLSFSAKVGTTSAIVYLTITNTGTSLLAIPSDGLTITGTNAGMFIIQSRPAQPMTIAAGKSVTLGIVFSPKSTTAGKKTATLQIKSNDPTQPLVSVSLTGTAS